MRLWDTASDKAPGKPLAGHASLVTDVAFSPDNRLLASGSEAGQGLLWDVSPLFQPDETSAHWLGQPLVNGDRVWRVTSSPDGQVLASTGRNDGAIMLWQVKPEAWLTQICQIVRHNLTRTEWQRFLDQNPYRSVCPAAPPAAAAEATLAVPTPVVTPPLPAVAQADQPGSVAPIVEEFDSAQGFIQTSDNVLIADGRVNWHI